MEWVEASGKSLTEAREHALDLLGVAEDDAEIVVVSEPRPGLFGRMRGEARVQARVRPMAPPPKRGRAQRGDRRGTGSRRERTGRGGEDGRGGQANGRPRDGEAPTGTRAAAGAAGEDDGGAGRRVGTETTGNRTAGNGTGSGARRRRRGGSRPAGAGGTTGSSVPGTTAVPAAFRPEGRSAERDETMTTGGAGRQHDGAHESEDNMEESLTLAEQGAAARTFVVGLLEQFGVAADVETRELDEDTVEIAASGNDLGLLVGPRGATLAAIQDLTRTVVQRQSVSRTDRILVDIGGYREKRSAALRRFTQGVAEEVLSSGSERALEPMSAADRKVVHDTVNEIDGVQTRSEGEDPRRYIVIQPSD